MDKVKVTMEIEIEELDLFMSSLQSVVQTVRNIGVCVNMAIEKCRFVKNGR